MNETNVHNHETHAMLSGQDPYSIAMNIIGNYFYMDN